MIIKGMLEVMQDGGRRDVMMMMMMSLYNGPASELNKLCSLSYLMLRNSPMRHVYE